MCVCVLVVRACLYVCSGGACFAFVCPPACMSLYRMCLCMCISLYVCLYVVCVIAESLSVQNLYSLVVATRRHAVQSEDRRL
jgi:hypothetical protein